MSNYMYWAEDSSEAIEHYGTLGMKWGRRRYQYEDGSLTPEGRERYLSGIFNNIKNAGKASTNGYKDIAGAAKIKKQRQNAIDAAKQRKQKQSEFYRKNADQYANDHAKYIDLVKAGRKAEADDLYTSVVAQKKREEKTRAEHINSELANIPGSPTSNEYRNQVGLIPDMYRRGNTAAQDLGIAGDAGYQNTINNITASQQSGRYRARSGRQGSIRKNDPQLSKEYSYNDESNDYDLNTTQPENTETENTIKEEQHIYPNGSDNQSWYAQFTYNNGKTSIKIVDKKYENSRKDTRNIVQKAADTYVSGWNTIKDTYVSGLKTIAGWFK